MVSTITGAELTILISVVFVIAGLVLIVIERRARREAVRVPDRMGQPA